MLGLIHSLSDDDAKLLQFCDLVVTKAEKDSELPASHGVAEVADVGLNSTRRLGDMLVVTGSDESQAARGMLSASAPLVVVVLQKKPKKDGPVAATTARIEKDGRKVVAVVLSKSLGAKVANSAGELSAPEPIPEAPPAPKRADQLRTYRHRNVPRAPSAPKPLRKRNVPRVQMPKTGK